MRVLHELSRFDNLLLSKINRDWTHPWLDKVLPVVTDLHKEPAFLITAAVGLGIWLWRERGGALRVLFGLALAIALTDAVSHRVLKPYFRRPRPPVAGFLGFLRTNPHGGWSFPSNHAANCFSGAAFLGSLYPAASLPMYGAAAVVAYSRVYCGVHYPLDVLAGAVLGLCIGLPVARLYGAARWAARPPPKKR